LGGLRWRVRGPDQISLGQVTRLPRAYDALSVPVTSDEFAIVSISGGIHVDSGYGGDSGWLHGC
jgi:hypothetical protein